MPKREARFCAQNAFGTVAERHSLPFSRCLPNSSWAKQSQGLQRSRYQRGKEAAAFAAALTLRSSGATEKDYKRLGARFVVLFSLEEPCRAALFSQKGTTNGLVLVL